MTSRVTRGSVIVAVALAVRLAHWLAVRHEPFVAELVTDSAEYERWARAIAAGDWLGREAFFQAPLYPYLLALVHWLGGSLDAVYLAQVVIGSLACLALARATAVMAGETEGLVAGVIAALYGPFVFHDVQILKESLAVSLACALLLALATARRATSRLPARWALAGLLLGTLALLRENALLLTPLILLLVPRPGLARRTMAVACFALLAGVVAPLAPVAARNAAVSGEWLLTTNQGGVNLWIGNNPDADGTYRPLVPGRQVPAQERREPERLAELAQGRELTPREVSRFWTLRVARWALDEPSAFVALQARKLALYWSWREWPDAVDYADMRERSAVLALPLVEFGALVLLAGVGVVLAARDRSRLAALAPALVLAVGWMLATVVFFLFSRYRLPAVPAMIVLAAIPVAAALRSLREKRRWARLALAGVVAAWLAPHLIAATLGGREPQRDLVAYNLALLDEEHGRLEAAEAHYREAIAANPSPFLPHMNLGAMLARRGDLAGAREHFEVAAARAPESPDAQANLGAVELALGDDASAKLHLDRALKLDAGSFAALHGQSMLALWQGDIEAASRYNARALAIDATSAAALRVQARIESEEVKP